MSAPSVEQAVLEMRGVAERLRAEAAVMRAATERQGRRYIVSGVIIAAYMSWAFVRTAQFVDADRLAAVTGDLAMASASELVDDASTEDTLSPSQVLRYAEGQLTNDVAESGKSIHHLLETELPAAIAAYYAPADRALINSIARLPNGSKLIAAAGSNPAAAAKLLLANRPDTDKNTVPPSLAFIRDRVQRLASRQSVSIGDQAQRRILQAAFAETAGDEKP